MLHLFLKKVARFPTFIQMMKFGIIGFVNTGVDFSIYFALTRSSGFWLEHYIGANLIAMFISATQSFIGNKYWTFRDNCNAITGQYLKFFFVSIVGLFFNAIIFYILVDKFAIYDMIAKALAVVAVFFWNFSVNKLWTFRSVKYSLIKIND